MARKTNEFLGMMKLEIEFYADGDGDVTAKVRDVDTLRMMTEDLEYIVGAEGRKILPKTESEFEDYRYDPSSSLLASIESSLEEALATRPNRTNK